MNFQERLDPLIVPEEETHWARHDCPAVSAIDIESSSRRWRWVFFPHKNILRLALIGENNKFLPTLWRNTRRRMGILCLGMRQSFVTPANSQVKHNGLRFSLVPRVDPRIALKEKTFQPFFFDWSTNIHDYSSAITLRSVPRSLASPY